MEGKENDGKQIISPNTKITVTLALTILPLIVWATRLDQRVERLEQERQEMRADMKELITKVNVLLHRNP